MQITNNSYKEISNAEIISAMENSDVTIGNNPSLPYIIEKTWNWPHITVAFFVDTVLVGIFTAVRIRNVYVSLPHFSHSAYWVDTSHLIKKLERNVPDIDLSEEELIHLFYGFFNKVLEENSGKNQASVKLKTDLSLSNVLDKIKTNTKENSLQIESRSFQTLTDNYANHKTISEICLAATMDSQMQSFSPSVKRKIRKARSNGIEIFVGDSEYLKDFYSVYRKNIHRLGSFALPYRFYENLLCDYSNGICKIIIAKLQGKVVGSAILLSFMDYSENPWFATLKEYNRLYVSYALHEKMLELAIAEKCRVYSMGRSTIDSGVHKYKMQWGGNDKTLFYNFTFPHKAIAENTRIINSVIKRLPQSFVKIFDSFVSKFIY
ncbi:MAG: peptidoglycan bridge formation glycyltransferase FemA/FemB family protein [Bacteroidota bacterium]|nr:peptidoglycan bridge formation glycyltransferase FemA/FemB family protein [Bacteroidota bacterium]